MKQDRLLSLPLLLDLGNNPDAGNNNDGEGQHNNNGAFHKHERMMRVFPERRNGSFGKLGLLSERGGPRRSGSPCPSVFVRGCEAVEIAS